MRALDGSLRASVQVSGNGPGGMRSLGLYITHYLRNEQGRMVKLSEVRPFTVKEGEAVTWLEGPVREEDGARESYIVTVGAKVIRSKEQFPHGRAAE